MSEVVDTTAGAVRGDEGDGVVAFKGIPYGDDTSGEGRFARRDRRSAWAGVRDCVEYGPSCPQVTVAQMTGQELPAEIETLMGVWNHERRTGEDCLVLNVWTPGVGDGASRPVLVWLHGGGMAVGSASWPLYDFTNLARNNDVVVVGVNHRLGVLGFLDVSHLGDEFADSGNVGMLDIVAALEWVRDNIAQFGGDPSNVTIFGESGGGSKVTCLLGMPSAQGLFRSACAMSGALLEARTPEAARGDTDAVLEHLGVGTDVEALAQARRRRDRAGIRRHLRQWARGGACGLRPDTRPQPAASIPSTRCAPDRAPTSTSCSGAPPTRWSRSWEHPSSVASDEATRARDAARHARRRRRRVVRAVSRCESRRLACVALLADRVGPRPCASRTSGTRRRCSTAARRTRACTCSTSAGPSPDGVERAGHGSDMPFFFDNLDKAPASDGPHAAPLVRAMSGALVALARSGDPNHDGDPDVAGATRRRDRADDGLRRRVARRERPDVGRAARLGRTAATRRRLG